MFAGEIDVDEMVEIFSLMYTVQVVIVSICNFTFNQLEKLEVARSAYLWLPLVTFDYLRLPLLWLPFLALLSLSRLY